MSFDSSKVSGPDYVPEVILKNCEPELYTQYFYSSIYI